MKYCKDTQYLLKNILQRYLKQQQIQNDIMTLINLNYEIAPMKSRVPTPELHAFVCDTLRLTASIELIKNIKQTLSKSGVRRTKQKGYWYFCGLKKRPVNQTILP